MLGSSILNDLLFDPAYLIIAMIALIVLLLLLNLVNMIKIHGLKKKYKAFMEGSDAKSLEKLIQDEVKTIAKLQETDETISTDLDKINHAISGCYQKMAIIKYDALTMAGKISFVLALLDMKNDGFIINNIHTREGSYLYLKEIKDGKCETTLGKEEAECLKQAIASR